MKYVLIFLFTITGSLLMAAPSFDYQQKVEKDSLSVSPTVSYEVFGMDCPGCESALEKQLNKIDGVEKVKASWEKQQVQIWTSDEKQPAQEEIVKRIKKANFTPGEEIKAKIEDEK